jgi:hypothetical protein
LSQLQLGGTKIRNSTEIPKAPRRNTSRNQSLLISKLALTCMTTLCHLNKGIFKSSKNLSNPKRNIPKRKTSKIQSRLIFKLALTCMTTLYHLSKGIFNIKKKLKKSKSQSRLICKLDLMCFTILCHLRSGNLNTRPSRKPSVGGKQSTTRLRTNYKLTAPGSLEADRTSF